MNVGIIILILLGIGMTIFIVYLKYYTADIDWSKKKKIKDPLKKLKSLK